MCEARCLIHAALLDQANCSCEGPDSKNFDFVGHVVFGQLLKSAIVA